MVLLRIAEIIHVMEPIPSNGYFYEFWVSLDSSLVKKKVFQDLENYLQDVEEDQWKLELPKLAKKFNTKHDSRGWEQAFDAQRELVAYSILKRRGYLKLNFIPRVQNQKTPDLHAVSDDQSTAIEVKCINRSDEEIDSQNTQKVKTFGEPLKDKFFLKLENVLKNAGGQLSSFNCQRREVFVFIEFDDSLNEYVEKNLEQIKNWLANHTMVADRYYLFVHPAFYSVEDVSTAPHIVVWPIE